MTTAAPGCQRGGAAIPVPPPRGSEASVVQLPVGSIPIWLCIHGHEAAWNDPDPPFWGGLQMDWGFFHTYGRDMLRKYRGRFPDAWSPRDQMVVAWRAVVGYAGYGARGYGPWPHTRIGCA
jgi:hypothetical protein